MLKLASHPSRFVSEQGLVLNCFQVFQHKEKISDISSQASNEATLEQMLQKVKAAIECYICCLLNLITSGRQQTAAFSLCWFMFWFNFSFGVVWYFFVLLYGKIVEGNIES